MEEIEDNTPDVSSTDEDENRQNLSPSQRKLAEVNAHFAKTDMTLKLIEEIRTESKAKEQ